MSDDECACCVSDTEYFSRAMRTAIVSGTVVPCHRRVASIRPGWCRRYLPSAAVDRMLLATDNPEAVQPLLPTNARFDGVQCGVQIERNSTQLRATQIALAR